MNISIIIPTHNPNPRNLSQTLESLKKQTFPLSEWELLLIDNASSSQYAPSPSLVSWHPHGRIIVETSLGLTPARLCGFNAAQASLMIMVDDDNILDPDYLQMAFDLFQKHPLLGAAGGKVVPLFEKEPPASIQPFFQFLPIQDFGDSPLLFPKKSEERKFRLLDAYPRFAPIGAGMILRKDPALVYAHQLEITPFRKKMDRTGKSLASSGDNDLVCTILEQGWQIGYFPELRLQHIIPPHRTTQKYFSHFNQSASCSWMQMLAFHNICSWTPIHPITIPLRVVKAFIRNRAWESSLQYVQWKGACGHFKGRSLIWNYLPQHRTLPQKLGLGRLFYRWFYRPKNKIKKILREKSLGLGIFKNQKAMECSVPLLPPLPLPQKNVIPIHFLTGKKFWYQTAYCFYSLQFYSSSAFRPVFHDDGSLQPHQFNILKTLFPNLEYVTKSLSIEKLHALLPEKKFPFIHNRWNHYPNIRKLIDPHLNSTGMKWVFDSDMLFFKKPDALLEHLRSSLNPICLKDFTTSYGYPTNVLSNLIQCPAPEKINVGICGLQSQDIDWELIEFWTRQLFYNQGHSYYLEQALVAMLLARQTPTILPDEHYIVMPTEKQCSEIHATLHHYVDTSRKWFFCKTWKYFYNQTKS